MRCVFCSCRSAKQCPAQRVFPICHRCSCCFCFVLPAAPPRRALVNLGHSGRLSIQALRCVDLEDGEGRKPRSSAVQGLRRARGPLGVGRCLAAQAAVRLSGAVVVVVVMCKWGRTDTASLTFRARWPHPTRPLVTLHPTAETLVVGA